MPCTALPHTRHVKTQEFATSAQQGQVWQISFKPLYSSSSDRDEMSRRVSRPYTREPVRDSLTTMGT